MHDSQSLFAGESEAVERLCDDTDSDSDQWTAVLRHYSTTYYRHLPTDDTIHNALSRILLIINIAIIIIIIKCTSLVLLLQIEHSSITHYTVRKSTESVMDTSYTLRVKNNLSVVAWTNTVQF